MPPARPSPVRPPRLPPPRLADQGYRVVTNYAQQNRMVNNRAFYLNGNQWTDARVQQLLTGAAKPERVKITFNSDAYFALLKNHPEVAPWLSLGNNVSFELAGKIYDVVEDTTPPATPN